MKYVLSTDIPCTICGRPTKQRPSRPPAKYCSMTCRKVDGTWLKCNRCHKTYKVSPSRVRTSRFCSKTCFDEAQTTSEIRFLKCEGCGAMFKAKADHGRWPRFCSRTCFLAKCMRPIDKECRLCGGIFRATRSSHGYYYRIYCSVKCSHKAKEKKIEVPCLECGCIVLRQPSNVNRANHTFCSPVCRYAFLRGDKAPGWRGGRYVAYNGVVFIATKDGYRAEHRLIAEELLGRSLMYYGEPIVHLNGDVGDNRPENLYMFLNMSEMQTALQGGWFPPRSNLLENKRRAPATT